MSLRTVAVLIPPHPGVFELGVVHEVFGLDRTAEGVPPMDLRLCSDHPGEPIPLGNGLSLTTSHGVADADEADLVIATAYPVGAQASPAMVEALRRAHARGAYVLSVCSGAFMLGEAGLLDGRACTTHWVHTDELSNRFPAAKVDPGVLFVEDDRVITSAGTAAGIDACLHHIRCELGAGVATTIARRMVVPPQRDGGQRQYVDLPVPACTAESLTPLLAWMREHLAEDQPVRDLARRVNLSERTFARRFVAETGTTPAKWLLAQRLHHARELLEASDLPIESVAARSGFASASLLRHHFGAQVGVSPADYRRSFGEVAAPAGR